MIKKIFLYLLISACAIESNPNHIRSFEGGDLYQQDKLHILKLKGSWHQMGCQYGMLVKDMIHDSVDHLIQKLFIESGLLTFEQVQEKGQASFELFSGRLQQLIYGMAETSGIDYITLSALCNFWWLCLEKRFHVFGCTSMISWDSYTHDGQTLFAHNFDYCAIYREFNDLNLVIAYQPDDGSNALVTMCQAGQITAPIFWITKDIAASANDGSSNGGMNMVHNRLPWPFVLFEHLLNAQSLRAYAYRIHTSNTNFSCIPYAADKDRGIAFDWAVFGLKERPLTDKGLHVILNDFTHPEWFFVKADDDPSVLNHIKRRKAVNYLINRFSPFTTEAYKNLYATPWTDDDNSGFTMDKKLANKCTVIQYVVTPGRDDLWLRMPEYIDEWQHMSLSWLLQT